MPGEILNIASSIQCMHGGQAILFSSNTRLMVDNLPALLETDMHPVVGCPFTVGLKYQPCVRIEWSGGSPLCAVNGVPVLVRSSIGKCFSAEGALQGIAIVGNTQPKVNAL
jgi:hypothetical protein